MAEKTRENGDLKRQLESFQERWDKVVQVSSHPFPKRRCLMTPQDRVAMELELKDLKTLNTRLSSESQTTNVALDTARDREFELSNELNIAKRQVETLEKSLATAVADDREKKKAEMLAEMMAKIDTVRPMSSTRCAWLTCRRTR